MRCSSDRLSFAMTPAKGCSVMEQQDQGRFRLRRLLRDRCHALSSFSTSDLSTAITRFVRFISRSIGVWPGTLIFIGVSFCRVEAAATLACYALCGSSLPVNSAYV